jgi:hypothetical protein
MTANSVSKEKTYTVGQRVEKLCPDCGEQLGHMVKSVTKLGRVSRVICSHCGKVGTFKAGTPVTAEVSGSKKPGTPYDGASTFRTGQVMQHSVFGRGKVVKVLSNRMIDVLFEDRVRRLIHSRPSS